MSNSGFKPEAPFSQGGFYPSNNEPSQTHFEQKGFQPSNNGFSQGGFKQEDGGFTQGGFHPTEDSFNSQGFAPVKAECSSAGFQAVTDLSQGNKGYQPPGVQEVKRADLSNLREAIARGKQSLAEAEEILEKLNQ